MRVTQPIIHNGEEVGEIIATETRSGSQRVRLYAGDQPIEEESDGDDTSHHFALNHAGNLSYGSLPSTFSGLRAPHHPRDIEEYSTNVEVRLNKSIPYSLMNDLVSETSIFHETALTRMVRAAACALIARAGAQPDRDVFVGEHTQRKMQAAGYALKEPAAPVYEAWTARSVRTEGKSPGHSVRAKYPVLISPRQKQLPPALSLARALLASTPYTPVMPTKTEGHELGDLPIAQVRAVKCYATDGSELQTRRISGTTLVNRIVLETVISSPAQMNTIDIETDYFADGSDFLPIFTAQKGTLIIASSQIEDPKLAVDQIARELKPAIGQNAAAARQAELARELLEEEPAAQSALAYALDRASYVLTNPSESIAKSVPPGTEIIIGDFRLRYEPKDQENTS